MPLTGVAAVRIHSSMFSPWCLEYLDMLLTWVCTVYHRRKELTPEQEAVDFSDRFRLYFMSCGDGTPAQSGEQFVQDLNSNFVMPTHQGFVRSATELGPIDWSDAARYSNLVSELSESADATDRHAGKTKNVDTESHNSSHGEPVKRKLVVRCKSAGTARLSPEVSDASTVDLPAESTDDYTRPPRPRPSLCKQESTLLLSVIGKLYAEAKLRHQSGFIAFYEL